MAKHKEITDETHIKNLIKNYNLLRIVEKLEVRRTVTKKSFKTNADNSYSRESDTDNINTNALSNARKKNNSEEGNKLSNENKDLPEEKHLNEQKEKIDKIEKLLIDSVNKKKDNSGLVKQGSGNNILNNNNNPNQNLLNSNSQVQFVKLDNIDPEQKCKRHDSVVIAYAVGTNILHCEKCFQESPMKVLPLPNIIKDIKKKVDSSRVQICLLKHEIIRLYEFFESYQEEFEKSNKQKIDDLFSYLYKIISFNYNTAIQILRQCKGEQKTQIDMRIQELKDLEKELDDSTHSLDSIQKMNEKDLLEIYANLNDIYERVMNFINYDSELSLLTMKIGIKNEDKTDIFQLIQDSYSIDVEFANIQGETPTIKHILQKKQFWSCFCGELNNLNNSIVCSTCSAFRRLETIDNLYSHPDTISSDNLKLLVLRRKTESKMFQDFIKESDILLSQGKPFYVLEIEWFLLWKCFVTNDLTEKNLSNHKKKISINKLIGKNIYYNTYI